ncbi:MAG: DUF3014 domain-containing protein [Rubrivivax sp.]|nr:DUF3014 domain-containing protein [Rubrivivax sp.]
MKHPAIVLTVSLVLAAVGWSAWHWRAAWWPGAGLVQPVRVGASAAAPAAATATPAATAPPQSPAATPAPPVRHPIEAASAAGGPGPAAGTLRDALAQLFSAETLATLVLAERFAPQLVATVDNLGREKAPARLWPVAPPAGRFTPRRHSGAEVLGAENFVRYTRHLALVEQVDLRLAVALYKRFYPQFQRAYEDLGYPGRHFNDRLVEVIDLLLAAPVPAEPVAVHVPAIHGPVQPERPWLLYEFVDPRLQAQPAGVQLMLRMGPEQQRRVQARLRELRGLVAR